MRCATMRCVRRISLDNTATAVGGVSMGQEVRNTIDLFKAPGQEPDNMGKYLGGDEIGIGADCSHLEGPHSEVRNHSKIGAALNKLFPAGFSPPENALEIATAPSPEELQAQEENEMLKDKIRERYRHSVDLRQKEKERIDRANKHLEAAMNGTPSITETMRNPPVVPGAARIYEQFGDDDPFEAVETMGTRVETFLKKDKDEAKTQQQPKAAAPPSPKPTSKLSEVEAVQRILTGMSQDLEAKIKSMIYLKQEGGSCVEEQPKQEGKKVTLRERMQLKKAGKKLTEEDKLRMRVYELEAKNIELRMEKERERLYVMLRV